MFPSWKQRLDFSMTCSLLINLNFLLFKARGNVPNLAYHSAVCYKKELFVFGGVQPSHSLGDKSCSNALYIFNPDHELWYKPIVEGNKPLPRFGSVDFVNDCCSILSATVAFGGLTRCCFTGTQLHFSLRNHGWSFLVDRKLRPTSMICMF